MKNLRSNLHIISVVCSLTAAGLLVVTPGMAGTLCGLLVMGVPDHDTATVSDAGAVSVLTTLEDTGITSSGSRLFTQNSYDFGSSPAEDDHLGRSVIVGDFNGDHYADVAIGVPFEDVNGTESAGAVQVVYGTPFSFLTYTTTFIHQGLPGVSGNPSYRAHFGSAVAAGDFNGDGYDDLAIGAPDYFLSSPVGQSGAVNIIYGAADGLAFSGIQLWTQDSPGILDDAEDPDRFGAALAAGDFDGDGYDDLAIGVPGEDVDYTAEAGAVNVLYGTSGGLTSARNQLWTQGGDLDGEPAYDDNFGASLAVGDFNGDGKADLAIGVPNENIPGGGASHGAVHMLCGWGAGLGLVGWNDQFWSQNTSGMQDDAEPSDHFGAALAVGDFNGDGYDDLAVGIPHEDFVEAAPPYDLIHEAGSVQIIFGSASWLDVGGNLLLHQDTSGVASTPEESEEFGTSLSAADLDCDGYADLAVGVPGEDPDGITDGGVVHVFFGAPAGPSGTTDEIWSLNTPGVEGSTQFNAVLGTSVAAGNVSLLFADGFEHGTMNRWIESTN